MRKPFTVACLFFLVVAAFSGCSSAANTPAANGVDEPRSDGVPRQYRAVCVDKDLHGGSEYVLTRWLESRDNAQSIANYHTEFKYKGHRSRIDARVKPSRAAH